MDKLRRAREEEEAKGKKEEEEREDAGRKRDELSSSLSDTPSEADRRQEHEWSKPVRSILLTESH